MLHPPMGSLRNAWTYRGDFGTVDIELRDGASGDKRGETATQLHRLLFAFVNRNAEARRVVLAIYARMSGVVGSNARASTVEFDTRSPRAAAMRDEILRAGADGRLVARGREVQSIVVAVPDAGDAALGPNSSSTHVYKLYVVDDTGAPVSGAKLTVDIAGDKQDKTTDGSGKVSIEKPDPGTATVTLTNLDELRDKLWSQWAKPLATDPPAGDQITESVVTKALPPLKAPSDWLVTLVLQRPPIWRVRMVGMIFDADKCFVLPQALGGVQSIVAMQQAHPTAQVLVVGHEGGDEMAGSVDLALARAKILNGYLTSKSDDWMPWFGSDKSDRQRWGTREVQLILSAVAGADGSPYYVGTASGVTDDTTTKALRAFQTDAGLPVDGRPGASTQAALVKKYMSLEGTTLPASVTPVAHGCTGHEDDTMTQDGLQPDDRRLEVLFFDGTEIKPPPSGDTSDGGSPEYPAWRARLIETVDFENHGIHVQILDVQKQPVAFADVHLAGPTSEDSTTDAHGFVTFWGLVAGDYTVTGMTTAGQKLAPSKLTYPTAKTVAGTRRDPSPAAAAAS